MSTTETTGASPREPASVHFPASLAAAARRAASFDGAASVGEWVTRMVEQEIRRREGRCPECGAERAAS